MRLKRCRCLVQRCRIDDDRRDLRSRRTRWSGPLPLQYPEPASSDDGAQSDAKGKQRRKWQVSDLLFHF